MDCHLVKDLQQTLSNDIGVNDFQIVLTPTNELKEDSLTKRLRKPKSKPPPKEEKGRHSAEFILMLDNSINSFGCPRCSKSFASSLDL